MPQRRKRKPRCPGCGLTLELCACDLLPRVVIKTPLAVVQHVRERFKPTNTGRLLASMVPAVQILPYAMREPPFDPAPLQIAGVEFAVLFPREDATALASAPGPGRGFVLLDGTWHQCSRMTRRVPVVQDLPCVVLPPGARSIWSVRTQHDEQGLSTFEAAVRLLRVTEGDAVADPLMDAFKIITARLLFMKGKLPSPDVPDAWPEP